MEHIENEIEENQRFFMYCRLESTDLDSEGNIHLILSKDSQFPTTLDVCKILRKYFQEKDLILIFNYLIRNIKSKINSV